MFLRRWSHITGRQGGELPCLMLALVAGWVLLELELPGARAQGPMMGMGGMMLWPPPPMTMRPMNANGMGYSLERMAFPGVGIYGGYSGGGPYGPQGGNVNRSSTESPLPRSLDGYIDGSSTSSSFGTSGSRNRYADRGGHRGSQDGSTKGGSTESPLPRSLDGYIGSSSTSSSSGTSRSRNGYADGNGHPGSQDGYTKRSSSESPLPRSLDGYIDGSSTSSSNGASGSRDGYADGDRRYGSQDDDVKRDSTESPLPRSLDGYIDSNSASISSGTSGSRNVHADSKPHRERKTAPILLIFP